MTAKLPVKVYREQKHLLQLELLKAMHACKDATAIGIERLVALVP